MTDRKEDPKGKTLGRQMAEEAVAAINKRVMEKEQKGTEKPQEEAAETSANERPNFPSAKELGIAFAAAINEAVMEDARKDERREKGESK
jgi:hypothetical protein